MSTGCGRSLRGVGVPSSRSLTQQLMKSTTATTSACPTFQQARPGPWAKVGHESQLAKYLMSVNDDSRDHSAQQPFAHQRWSLGCGVTQVPGRRAVTLTRRGPTPTGFGVWGCQWALAAGRTMIPLTSTWAARPSTSRSWACAGHQHTPSIDVTRSDAKHLRQAHYIWDADNFNKSP